LAKKSGSLKTKRAAVPSFWKISKKEKRFVVRTSPGPHPKSYSYPLLVLLRDVLGVVKTRREALTVLNSGQVRIDGRAVKSESFPVGLMDVVEFPKVGKAYRLVPAKGRLSLVEISDKEKDLKLCLVKGKYSIKGSKLGYGLHDGRTIFPEAEVDTKPGDACILRVPAQEFQGSFRLGKGGLALIMRGDRSGEVATVEDMKSGTFSRGSIATVRLPDGTSSELPTSTLLPLGKQMPEITVSGISSAA
jgi:small subunit ribosomal protein S4e